MMCCHRNTCTTGVLFLGFGQAVIVTQFEEEIRHHEKTKKPKKSLTKIFHATPPAKAEVPPLLLLWPTDRDAR